MQIVAKRAQQRLDRLACDLCEPVVISARLLAPAGILDVPEGLLHSVPRTTAIRP
jgi:hypothetical protein